MSDLKVGKKYIVHCYKHNSKLHKISGESTLLDIKDDYLVFANNKTKVIEEDGRTWRTKEVAIMFFYKNNWYNIIGQFKNKGIFYYCNIASPYVIEDNVLKYIDYDLDLRVFNNGAFKILDRDEYEYNRKLMNYSEGLDKIFKYELSNLIDRVRKKEGPFNHELLNKYYRLYIEKYNKGIKL